jgi:hypothetical protein
MCVCLCEDASRESCFVNPTAFNILKPEIRLNNILKFSFCLVEDMPCLSQTSRLSFCRNRSLMIRSHIHGLWKKMAEIGNMLILKQVLDTVTVTVFYRTSSFKPALNYILISSYSISDDSVLQEPACACAKITSFLGLVLMFPSLHARLCRRMTSGRHTVNQEKRGHFLRFYLKIPFKLHWFCSVDFEDCDYIVLFLP